MITFSVSTWQQPMPPDPAPMRATVLDAVARRVAARGPGRLRVGIDGYTAAGKTSLGHELARALAALGRPVLRASLDDFKRPWADRHLYDRLSGEGYYRNAFDYPAVRRVLLDPLLPGGSGSVALCAIDPLTQIDHTDEVTVAAPDAILLVDGVFAFRPELDAQWDLRIWVQVDEPTSLRRGRARDGDDAVHRDRYLPAERLYLAEEDPVGRADMVIDNTDLEVPRLLRV